MHVPQVHAFNVMRAAFADRELSTETVGFAARGLTAAIKGFSSPHWEVRSRRVPFFPLAPARTSSLKSSLPTLANYSRVRFVLQPQHARVSRGTFSGMSRRARARVAPNPRAAAARDVGRDSNTARERRCFLFSFFHRSL